MGVEQERLHARVRSQKSPHNYQRSVTSQQLLCFGPFAFHCRFVCFAQVGEVILI